MIPIDVLIWAIFFSFGVLVGVYLESDEE